MRPEHDEVLTSGIAVILQEIDRISSLDSVMALNIKDARTDRLARELAQLTGQYYRSRRAGSRSEAAQSVGDAEADQSQ